jgi:hypothetical protein
MPDDLIQQLQDPDPAVRRQAIIALANSHNLAALQPLAAVYRGDPDPALRELALKAGRYLKQHGQPPPDSGDGTQEKQSVSDRERRMAKGHLDAAANFYTDGDRARAVENLGKALVINPALAKDRFAINLITMTTGLAVADAMPILTHPDRRAALIEQIGGKRKLKRTQAHGKGAESATWDNVLMDFGIYWVVNAIVMAGIFILTIDTLRDLVEGMPTTASGGTTIDWDALWTASVAAMVLFALAYSAGNVIQLAIQGAAIHTAAIYVFAGNGTLAYLYRRLVPFQTIVVFAFGAIFVLLAISGSSMGLWFMLPLVMMGGAVVVIYLLSKLVGEVYGMGAGSGCGAILVGGILLAALSCGANYLFFFIVGNLLGS